MKLYWDRRQRDEVVVAAAANRLFLQTDAGMTQATDSGPCADGREMVTGLDRRLDTEKKEPEMGPWAELETDLGHRRDTETRGPARASANTVADYAKVELEKRLDTDHNDLRAGQVKLTYTSSGDVTGVLERLPCMSSGDVAEELERLRGRNSVAVTEVQEKLPCTSFGGVEGVPERRRGRRTGGSEEAQVRSPVSTRSVDVVVVVAQARRLSSTAGGAVAAQAMGREL